MAIKPTDNEAFYREVDEELRRDQALQIWERHRRRILIGGLLLVAIVGGFIWWQNQRQARAEAQGEALVAIVEDMEKGAFAAVAPRIATLEQSGVEGARAAGLFSRANLLVEQGNVAAAVQVLQRLVADQDLPEQWRNAALVRQTALEFDRLQPDAIVRRLRPLVVRGNPWLGSAGELTAHAHIRQQRPDLAARVFAAIARDESVPESIRSRAVQMAGALGVDATQEAPAQPAPATKE